MQTQVEKPRMVFSFRTLGRTRSNRPVRLFVAFQGGIDNGLDQFRVTPSRQLGHDDQVAVIGIEAGERIYFEKMGCSILVQAKVDSGDIAASQGAIRIHGSCLYGMQAPEFVRRGTFVVDKPAVISF